MLGGQRVLDDRVPKRRGCGCWRIPLPTGRVYLMNTVARRLGWLLLDCGFEDQSKRWSFLGLEHHRYLLLLHYHPSQYLFPKRPRGLRFLPSSLLLILSLHPDVSLYYLRKFWGWGYCPLSFCSRHLQRACCCACQHGLNLDLDV